MITGIVTDEILAEMLRLRHAGRRLALISLDEYWMPRDDLEGIVVQVPGPKPQVSSQEIR
jgi:hypothetical protein